MPAGRLYGRSVLLQAATSLRFGVTPAELDELGLGIRTLEAPDLMIGAAAIYQHLERVASRGAFEPFAIELARGHSMGGLGPVGFYAQSARDGRACLEAMMRYLHLANTLARFEFLEVDGLARWIEHRPGPESLGRLLASEVAMLSSLHVARSLLRQTFVPTRLALLRRSADGEAYREFVGRAVEVGCSKAELVLPSALLDVPLATADPELAAYFQNILSTRQAAEGGGSVVAELRRVLPGFLGAGEPEIEEVARALGTSARSLQRRLEAEQLTYSAVVESVRAELADAYLGNPELTVAEIAFLLGYAEASSFHRAFRRWRGTTPQRFRAELRARTGEGAARR
ncbi:MAG: helix-turn-helix domain-containing protein [Deltaproteobacteria bacterium]|nr:helix-turn-helix domain-containing protein [Deltaproteobacteria bacterium]